jgi:protein-S-isoprenylcysteine O-methyltransferase Ste14
VEEPNVGSGKSFEDSRSSLDVEGISSQRSSEELAWQRKNRRLNVAFAVSIFLVTSWAFLATLYDPWTPLRVVGLITFIVSAALVFAARLQLGTSFSIGPQARRLVTTGLYSRIQNPIYFFAILTITGLIFFLNKPWYFLSFLVVIPVQMVRIRREREILSITFGERYEQYRKQTWF